MRRFVAIPLVIYAALALVPVTRGQEPAPPDVDPTLWKVLQYWESRSSKITRLQGEVLKRTYDMTFETETLGHGRLFYEAPDKGRLDMEPVEIKKKMVRDRNAPGARVRRGKNGNPFKLASAQKEKWVCDGQRLVSVNEADKSADVIPLPEELRGQNIMNGPLPFLFGLPPAQALARFDIRLDVAPTRSKPIARLVAVPRQRKDQQNWIRATILLNTKTGLPTNIELVDPGKTRLDVYQFAGLKPNPVQIPFFGPNPFKLNLRGYSVNIHDKDADTNNTAGGPPAQNRNDAVPNLVGVAHDVAEERLTALGLTRSQINLTRGPAAQRPNDVHRVMQQNPPAGTPLKKVERITLTLWTRPGKG